MVLAEDLTNYAEDRTVLANERTFSGWARTAMAAIGLGIGFHALFKPIEPTWAAKAIATLFIAIGIFLTVAAERRACSIHKRLSAHYVKRLPTSNFRVLTVAIVTGAIALIIAIWLLA